MELNQITRTDWYPSQKLIITQLSGNVDSAAINGWEQSLHKSLNLVEDQGTFKILVNLFGFKAMDFAAHKKFRTVIPETLASYGWRTGYLNLFEEAADLKLTNKRGIQCVAAAHVHQDATKIQKYEILFGKEDEHFFTNPEVTENWIKNYYADTSRVKVNAELISE
ncbi:hypothetical protein AHMF7605_16560 [Adhaeribacter arboris]|uniref:STAS/SEC14 domain-containing protein n=1 Tax=Adhaeribacter arboris TaxID=2072846 RepID=A0A2T2YHM3_9BACT|nr:hypothetical protein [Adhaeribacter arboris]PSR55001.1 hypothetical protein AHMF7605_16560 [Adhaeribacter arboris]